MANVHSPIFPNFFANNFSSAFSVMIIEEKSSRAGLINLAEDEYKVEEI
jgi:hypothetical protein